MVSKSPISHFGSVVVVAAAEEHELVVIVNMPTESEWMAILVELVAVVVMVAGKCCSQLKVIDRTEMA